jgi:uncharacterized protein YndB with AHSA1/START domain
MDARSEGEAKAMKSGTTAERTSGRELVVTRTFDGPARIVWEAWTRPELFKRWWVPKSFPVTLRSCELDIRVGGKYRLVFAHGDSERAFFGTYLEVKPPSRLVWTNEEGGDQVVTTVTFEDQGGKTLVVMHDLYPSEAALDEAVESGSTGAASEQFEALAALLVTLV